MNFTVFGADGFIGSALAKQLNLSGEGVWCPKRDDISSGAVYSRPLGNVIYAIGLTSNFRSRLSDTVEAHVTLLDRLLNSTHWESWLYLSSTRVYGNSSKNQAVRESDVLSVSPNLESIYDISKILGEALCLAQDTDTCRVARLSNVFGSGMPKETFLAALIEEAKNCGCVKIREHPQSSKDYISISEVVRYLVGISKCGRARIYNVATGKSIQHEFIAEIIANALDVDVIYERGATLRSLPLICADRVITEFGEGDTPVDLQLTSFIKSLKGK